MGTNYYAVPKPCPAACAHCSLSEVHIGKSLTMFRAYTLNPFDGTHDAILSWRDWRDELAIHAACVRDEYGTDLTLEEFAALVEATHRDRRERQYRWMTENAIESGRNDYLDIDGFSMCRGEFS